MMDRGVMSVSTRACTARLSPTYVQTREFHFDSWKQKIQMIKENKDFWVSDLNNQALKYGLFGVSVGTPTTWVVSLISWMNSLGLPWWGAITGGAFCQSFFICSVYWIPRNSPSF